MADDSHDLKSEQQVVLSGRTLNIVRRLGGGALGTSYLADEAGIPIVVKLFEPEYSETCSLRVQHYKESSFSSTGSVFGYQAMGIDEGRPYVLHEYVEARTFNEFAGTFRFNPKKPEPAAEVGAKLCQALAPLHAAGIIHGHLWNTNLFFGEYGDPLIVDPFIGAPTSNDLVMSSLPLPQLSPILAPEQKDVNGTLDPRTDIWHVGALLCRLLTGKPDLAINDVVLRELRRAKVPISLIRVIWQATHKDPSSRFADIGTLETALAEAFFPEHRKTVHVQPLPGATGVRESSPVLRRMLLGAAAIGCVLGAGWWISNTRVSKPHLDNAAQVPAIATATSRTVNYATVPVSTQELRGVLVLASDLRAGRASLEKQLDQAAKANFNTAFVSLLYSGYATFAGSPRLSQHPELAAEDPVPWLIEQSHRRGLQVFLHYNKPFSVGKGEVCGLLQNNPQMQAAYATDKLPGAQGLCPYNPAAQEAVAAVLADAVQRFSPDGVCLEGYRPASEAPCLCASCRKLFQQQTHVPLAKPPAGSMEARRLLDWQCQQVQRAVSVSSVAARQVHRRLPVIVCVFPPRLKEKFAQRWEDWVKAGDVNAVVVMMYGNTLDELEGSIRLAPKTAIVCGLVANSKTTPQRLIEDIKTARVAGVNGCFISSISTLSDYTPQLTSGPYGIPAVSSFVDSGR